MVLGGVDAAKTVGLGGLDVVLKRRRIKMAFHQEVDVLMVLHSTEHMLFGDEVILIPQIVQCHGGIILAAHRHISLDIIVMGVGVQQFGQVLLVV